MNKLLDKILADKDLDHTMFTKNSILPEMLGLFNK